MRYILLSVLLVLAAGPAQATPVAPSPEMDLGLASLVMVAGAAFLAHRRKRG